MVRRGSTVRVRQRALTERKSPDIGDFCGLGKHRGAPPQYLGTACRTRCAHEKCLQIDLLGGTAEHLLEPEGLDSGRPHSYRIVPANRHLSSWTLGDLPRWGTGFGADICRRKLISLALCTSDDAPRFMPSNAQATAVAMLVGLIPAAFCLSGRTLFVSPWRFAHVPYGTRAVASVP